jgi:hypothetical protein
MRIHSERKSRTESIGVLKFFVLRLARTSLILRAGCTGSMQLGIETQRGWDYR